MGWPAVPQPVYCQALLCPPGPTVVALWPAGSLVLPPPRALLPAKRCAAAPLLAQASGKRPLSDATPAASGGPHRPRPAAAQGPPPLLGQLGAQLLSKKTTRAWQGSIMGCPHHLLILHIPCVCGSGDNHRFKGLTRAPLMLPRWLQSLPRSAPEQTSGCGRAWQDQQASDYSIRWGDAHMPPLGECLLLQLARRARRWPQEGSGQWPHTALVGAQHPQHACTRVPCKLRCCCCGAGRKLCANLEPRKGT